MAKTASAAYSQDRLRFDIPVRIRPVVASGSPW
jgi:hypothetical protein